MQCSLLPFMSLFFMMPPLFVSCDTFLFVCSAVYTWYPSGQGHLNIIFCQYSGGISPFKITSEDTRQSSKGRAFLPSYFNTTQLQCNLNHNSHLLIGIECTDHIVVWYDRRDFLAFVLCCAGKLPAHYSIDLHPQELSTYQFTYLEK